MDYKDPRTWDISDTYTRIKVNTLDLCLNFFLFTPLVVLHYHATTALVDSVFLQYFPRIGPFLLLSVAVGVEFVIAFYQKRIPDYVPEGKTQEQDDFIKTISPKIYNLCLTFANVCHIRSIGALYELSTGGTTGSSVRLAITGVLILWGMRAGRNILSVPLWLSLDKEVHPQTYRFTTLFTSQVSLHHTDEQYQFKPFISLFMLSLYRIMSI